MEVQLAARVARVREVEVAAARAEEAAKCACPRRCVRVCVCASVFVWRPAAWCRQAPSVPRDAPRTLSASAGLPPTFVSHARTHTRAHARTGHAGMRSGWRRSAASSSGRTTTGWRGWLRERRRWGGGRVAQETASRSTPQCVTPAATRCCVLKTCVLLLVACPMFAPARAAGAAVTPAAAGR
jgi:hypothetical protein